MDYCSIFCLGDAANAFSVAAGLQIQGILSYKQLFLLDGDVLKTQELKEQVMRKRFSGDEVGKEEIRKNACRRIKEFNLPNGEQPEHYLWSLLKAIPGESTDAANNVADNQGDKHKYLIDICNILNEPPSIIYDKTVVQVNNRSHSVWRTIAATIKADMYQLRSHTKNKWQNETGSVEPSL